MREQFVYMFIIFVILVSIVFGGLRRLSTHGMTFWQIQGWHLLVMGLLFVLLFLSMGCTPY